MHLQGESMETDSPWNEQFIKMVAIEYKITPKATLVLIFKFVDNLDYEGIESKHKIKKATAQRRMTSVYQQFGIVGSDRGKDTELRRKLLMLHREYKREQSTYSFGEDSQRMISRFNTEQGSSNDIEIESLWEHSLSLDENIKRISLAIHNNEISPESFFNQLYKLTRKLPISDKELVLLTLDGLTNHLGVSSSPGNSDANGTAE
jgi:hypothetical protein